MFVASRGSEFSHNFYVVPELPGLFHRSDNERQLLTPP
jgi:hypothetical protein